MRISKDYVEMNRQMHEDYPLYGTSGGRWVSEVKRFCKTNNTYDLLDYGCGKGQLNKALPFDIAEYDPAIPGKDAEPEPHDLVFCVDVLEHIEPECLDNVLLHMASVMKMGGMLGVCIEPAGKMLPDGRNAHLIVKPISWWDKKIKEFFVIHSNIPLAIFSDRSGPASELGEVPNHYVCIVSPK